MKKELSEQLIVEWDHSLNGEPENPKITTKTPVWWVCSKNNEHEWKASTGSRVYGSSCPYCSGRYPVVGSTDLSTTHPELKEYWNTNKNDISITDVSKGSVKKVWWLCPKGHEWQAFVYNVSSGGRCPVCSGRKTIPGINDLKTTNPELAKEWHPTKNEIPIEKVSKGSNLKVWWVCPKNQKHEWKAQILSRTSGNGCSVCFGSTIIPGINDLMYKHPDIAKEWHPTKNGSIVPNGISPTSHKKVWWVCSIDSTHTWKTAIYNRVLGGTNCPSCSSVDSLSEKSVFEFVCSILPEREVLRNQRLLKIPHSNKLQEIDIFIPELNIGIEFNGVYWHSIEGGKDKYYHVNKRLSAEYLGIKLLTVWEDEWKYKTEDVKNYLKDLLLGNTKEFLYDLVIVNYDKISKFEIESQNYYLVKEMLEIQIPRKISNKTYQTHNSGYGVYAKINKNHLPH